MSLYVFLPNDLRNGDLQTYRLIDLILILTFCYTCLMKRPPSSGFTLIELLVVIAIIGLLATLAVLSFTSARLKGRDAKRMGDINGVFKALQSASLDDQSGLVCTAGCATTIGVGNCKLSACTQAGYLGSYLRLNSLKDPNAAATGACGNGSSTVCDYAIEGGDTPMNFTIWFYLEYGSGNLGAGLHYASGTYGIQ